MSLIGLFRPVPIRQRGLSLVELMVGITIGLFIVAAAVTLTSNQLVDNRRLLLELQIQQDLRATMDIMTRQLRRAGTNTLFAQARVAENGLGGIKPTRPDAEVTTPGTNQTDFRFYRNADEQGPFRFRLVPTADGVGVIETWMRPGIWQELTDRNAMNVTALTFESQPLVIDRLPCPKLCANGTNDCWPELVIQRVRINIIAEARSNPNIQRSLASDVRVRNDWLRDDAAAAVTQVCPV